MYYLLKTPAGSLYLWESRDVADRIHPITILHMSSEARWGGLEEWFATQKSRYENEGRPLTDICSTTTVFKEETFEKILERASIERII